jgi:hypothetical protein
VLLAAWAGTSSAGRLSEATALRNRRRPIEPVSRKTWSIVTQAVVEPGVQTVTVT